MPPSPMTSKSLKRFSKVPPFSASRLATDAAESTSDLASNKMVGAYAGCGASRMVGACTCCGSAGWGDTARFARVIRPAYDSPVRQTAESVTVSRTSMRILSQGPILQVGLAARRAYLRFMVEDSKMQICYPCHAPIKD